LDKEVTHFIASLSREILPIYHYSIFLEPIIPSFHYSNIPIAERSGAKFPCDGQGPPKVIFQERELEVALK